MTSQAPSGRAFERTHPWLDFAFDLRRLSHTDWLALGECASLCERIAGAPLDPATAGNIHTIYLAKGALATTAIEGNTLSEDEARARIDGELELPPSRQYLGQEIDNIVEAYETLIDELARTGRIALTVASIERMNRAVLRDLAVEDYVAPGRIRSMDVSVGGYRCPGWQDAAYLVGQLCRTLDRFPMPDERRRPFAILKAVFAHLYIAWIHPFGDGNGRTARLVELAILLEAGLPQPACHLPSNHYNRTRTEYYRRLSRASNSHSGPWRRGGSVAVVPGSAGVSPARARSARKQDAGETPALPGGNVHRQNENRWSRAGRTENGMYGFVSYAIAGLADELREQVEVIREHQWDVAWIDFIHREFGDSRSVTERRRRSLAVSLARTKKPVKIRDLETLNPHIAREYAKVSGRTLVRDVVALAGRGLLVAERGGVKSNRERVLAFLPWRHAPGGTGEAS